MDLDSAGWDWRCWSLPRSPRRSPGRPTARAQKRAIEAIARSGQGVVIYEEDYDPTARFGRKGRAVTHTPGFLERRLGPEYFRRVVGVSIVSRAAPEDSVLAALQDLPDLELLALGTVKDRQLKHVGRLRGLRILRLVYSGNTNAGIAELAPLVELRELELSRTGVTGDALKYISDLKHLESLDLSGACCIDDQSLEPLKDLPKLRELVLFDTPVRGVGLKSFKRLESLDLHWTNADDAGAQVIAGLSGLRRLALGHTKVGNRGAAALRSLERLESLDLSDTHVDNRAVESLSGIRSLTDLALSHTKIDSGALAILDRMPGLKSVALANARIDARDLVAYRKRRKELRMRH